ncbi:MAG: hypothetical protein WKG07_23895 [Hymenobacter sp.]
MKRSELLFSSLLLPVDAAAIFGAFMLAYYVRIDSGVLPVASMLPLAQFAQLVFLITLVWLADLCAATACISLRSLRRGLTEFSRIAAAITIGMLTVIAVIFFWRVEFFSRLVIVFAFAASLLTVSLARAAVRMLQRCVLSYGIGVRRALVSRHRPGRPADRPFVEQRRPRLPRARGSSRPTMHTAAGQTAAGANHGLPKPSAVARRQGVAGTFAAGRTDRGRAVPAGCRQARADQLAEDAAMPSSATFPT